MRWGQSERTGARHRVERRLLCGRSLCSQAIANDITNFLGAQKATVVEGPLAGQLYRMRLSETKLPEEEVNNIVRQMQSESKIVEFVAAKE